MRARWAIVAVLGLATVLLVGSTAAGAGKPSPVNPDEGLTEAQVLTRQAQLREKFEARLADWFANLDLAKIDLAALPHYERLATVSDIAPSLSAAVEEAAVVVTGTVVAIDPGIEGTIVTLKVDKVLKGPVSGGMVRFSQGATLRPTQDWSGIYIADSPGAALLLPGTTGEFLLDDHGSGGLTLQEGTGALVVSDGVVKAGPLNPFSDAVDGQSPAYVAAQTVTAASPPLP